MAAHVTQHYMDRFATNPLPLIAPVKLVAQTSIKNVSLDPRGIIQAGEEFVGCVLTVVG